MNDNMVVAVVWCVDVTRSWTIISHGVNVTGPRVPAQPGTSRVISTRTLHTHSSHTHGDAPSQNRYLAFIANTCLIFAMLGAVHILQHTFLGSQTPHTPYVILTLSFRLLASLVVQNGWHTKNQMIIFRIKFISIRVNRIPSKKWHRPMTIHLRFCVFGWIPLNR